MVSEATPSAVPQPELPGLADLRAETMLDELPAGAAELSGKELRFLLGITSGMTDIAAAIAAGYSEKSAPQIASELKRKPRLRNVYMPIVAKMGAEARRALARHEERGAKFHRLAMEALEQLETLPSEELRRMVAIGAKDSGESGRADQYMTRSALLKQDAERFARLAKDADDSLLRAAGKFGLKVEMNAEVAVKGAVTVTQLPMLADIRRDLVRHGT